MKSARVVIHTYSGRLGLTITPKSRGVWVGGYPKQKEKHKKKGQEGDELEERKKKGGLFDGRAQRKYPYFLLLAGERGERGQACGGFLLLYV